MTSKATGIVALALTFICVGMVWANGSAEVRDGVDQVSIDWVHAFWGDAVDPDNFFEDTVAQKLDVDLDFSLIPNSELEEKYNVMIASGDMPHIMPIWRNADFFKWARQGVFASLDEHWEDYPNLVEQYPPELLDISTRVEGKIHGIVHVVPSVSRFLGIRTDWLEAVGMDLPTDLDELMEIARAFTFEDPDGDGRDNTWAFGLDATLAEPLWFLAPTFRLHGITGQIPGALYPAGGEMVEASIWQPGFKDFVEFLRDAYAEGLINPESLTFTQGGSQIETELFWAGKTGMTGVLSGSISKWEIQLQENYPDAAIAIVDPLPGPYGEPVVVLASPVWRNYVVTSAVDDAQLLKAMEILDWIVSEEGAHFLAYGQENVHWEQTTELGIPIVTEKWHEDRWANIWRLPNRPQEPISIIRPSERTNEYADRMLDGLTTYQAVGVSLPSDALPSYPDTVSRAAELTPLIRAAVLKVVTGDEPMSHLDSVVEEVNRRGLTAAVSDINALLESQ